MRIFIVEKDECDAALVIFRFYHYDAIVTKEVEWSFHMKNVISQNMKFSIKDIFSKCGQIRKRLGI